MPNKLKKLNNDAQKLISKYKKENQTLTLEQKEAINRLGKLFNFFFFEVLGNDELTPEEQEQIKISVFKKINELEKKYFE